MKYAIVLKLEFDIDAERLNRSVEMDNDEFISSTATGKSIEAKAEADSLNGLLRTVDDFISCLQVAEKASRRAAPP